jgi:hypothetical protein
MRITRPASGVLLSIVFILNAAIFAQPAASPSHASATTPFTLDQGRIVVEVDLRLPDGSKEPVHAWIDNGNPDLFMNRRVARLMGLDLRCEGPVCVGTPKSRDAAVDVFIGDLKISSPIKEVRVPAFAQAVAPGMSAEITIPSSALRNYDVLIDFPDRKLTIGVPGSLKFNGVKSKVSVDANNGLIRIPSKIENKNYDFGLDLGSSANFLSEELFEKFSNAHSDWPHMTGAIGPFNTGVSDESKWKLMRLERMQFGPLFLSAVAIAELAKNGASRPAVRPEARVSSTRDGSLSAEALLNYRVGLDYAHATVYFDIGRTVRFPDFDVVGLILRPEDDNGFTVLGVADFQGKSSVPDVQPGDRLLSIDDTPVADFTLGQTWSLLQGAPGKERRLTVSREDKQFTVVARVQHFLGDAP